MPADMKSTATISILDWFPRKTHVFILIPPFLKTEKRTNTRLFLPASQMQAAWFMQTTANQRLTAEQSFRQSEQLLLTLLPKKTATIKTPQFFLRIQSQ